MTLLQRSQHSSQHIASRCAAEVADDWAARVAAKPALQAVLQVGGGATASAGQVGVTSLRAAQRPTPRATLAQMPATRSGRAPSSLEALAPRSHVYFVARCLRLFPSRAAATTEVARWCVQLAGQWAAKPFAAGYGAFGFSSSFFPVGLRIGDLPEGRMRANKADVSRQSSASFFVCSCQSREFTFHRSCGFILVQSWYKPVKNTRELCGWKFAFFQ